MCEEYRQPSELLTYNWFCPGASELIRWALAVSCVQEFLWVCEIHGIQMKDQSDKCDEKISCLQKSNVMRCNYGPSLMFLNKFKGLKQKTHKKSRMPKEKNTSQII